MMLTYDTDDDERHLLRIIDFSKPPHYPNW
jgi:hypothetical protein